jgi:hypothetical protein
MNNEVFCTYRTRPGAPRRWRQFPQHVTLTRLAGWAAPPGRIRTAGGRRSASPRARGVMHVGGGPQSAAPFGDQMELAWRLLHGARESPPILITGQGGLAAWAVVGGDGASVSRCACSMSWPSRSMASWWAPRSWSQQAYELPPRSRSWPWRSDPSASNGVGISPVDQMQQSRVSTSTRFPQHWEQKRHRTNPCAPKPQLTAHVRVCAPHTHADENDSGQHTSRRDRVRVAGIHPRGSTRWRGGRGRRG